MRLFVACLAVVPAVVAAYSCTHDFGGTSFDASSLRKAPAEAYDISDANAGDTPSRQYRYRFNVCDNATLPTFVPPIDPNPCQEGKPWAISPGYQYGTGDQTNGICYQMASPSDEPEFLLYDEFNPARGVIVRMPGGEDKYCQRPYGSTAPVKRHLEVALDCAPGVKDNIPDVELIYEKYDCQYQVYLQSHWGCPLECMSGDDDEVCSSRGVCGFNKDTQRSQCYCDEGFTGTHCTEKAAKAGGGVSAEGAFLIVACILVVFVIALTVFMFLKVRRLQVDPNAYGELKGRFNELGQVM